MHDHTQRLVRMGHGRRAAQDGLEPCLVRARGALGQRSQLEAGDDALEASVAPDHGIEAHRSAERIDTNRRGEVISGASIGRATTFVRITSRTNRMSSGSIAYSRLR